MFQEPTYNERLQQGMNLLMHSLVRDLRKKEKAHVASNASTSASESEPLLLRSDLAFALSDAFLSVESSMVILSPEVGIRDSLRGELPLRDAVLGMLVVQSNCHCAITSDRCMRSRGR